MRLALLTDHYPYAKTFSFVQDEIPFLLKQFERIDVFTLARGKEMTADVPLRVYIHRVWPGSGKIGLIRTLIKSFFAPHVWQEVRFATKELRFKHRYHVFHRIIGYEYSADILKNAIYHVYQDNAKDVLFYSYWLSMSAYALAQIRERYTNAVMISRAHGYDVFLERGYIAYRREVFAALDHIFCISKAGIDSIRERIFPHMESRLLPQIHLARLGVYDVAQDHAVRIASDGIIRIVSCSSMIPVKRLDLLISALQRIDEINVEWTHFGDGVERDSLIRMAQETLDEKQNITYQFRGNCNHAAIFAFYRDTPVDFILNCSDSEGVPVSIMEANMLSIPAIVRDVGGNAEIVRDGITGIVLAKDAGANEIADSIVRYSRKSDSAKQKMHEAARVMFETEYWAATNYEQFARDIIAIHPKAKIIADESQFTEEG
jgi:glycosyltransferase involved in cell wall biosynthesis